MSLDREVSVAMTEASEWLVRLQEDDVAESEVAAWLRWCAAKSANLEAFERVQSLYDQLQALPATERKAFLRLRPAVVTRSGAPELLARWLIRGRRHALPWLAGGGLAMAALVFVFIGMRGRSPTLEMRDYRASKGVQQSLLLADQSHITLASASELQSNFTPSMRYLDLREGEAYFEVQHDASRPFVVRAGAMTVTATGTKFNVRTSGSRSVVAVTEGSVDVTADDLQPHAGDPHAGGGTGASPLHLRAGQQAVREAHQPGLMVVDVNAPAATAWREGRLEYVMEPLSSVIDDVNRYSSRPIVIRDGAVGRMVFSGTVFVDRVNDWAKTLPAAFPVTTTAAADGSLSLALRAGAPEQRADFR